MSISSAYSASTLTCKIYCPVQVYRPVLGIPLINLSTVRFFWAMSWTYHSEVFNLGFYEKHDRRQSHTSAQIISSGLISRIFGKLLSPANDTWKCSGNALLCKAQTYARSFQQRTCPFLCFTQCTAPASPPATPHADALTHQVPFSWHGRNDPHPSCTSNGRLFQSQGKT